jgi:hypothetical protein
MSKISVSWSRRRLNGSTLERSLILAAEIVGSRRVLFTAPVVEKMKNQTIGSALAFKAGDPVETALRTALIAAICLKFDDQLPNRPRRA